MGVVNVWPAATTCFHMALDVDLNNSQLITEATLLVSSVSAGLQELSEQWREHLDKKDWTAPAGLDSDKYVIVERSVLEHLTTEIMMMKDFLPTVLSKEYISAQLELQQMKQKLSQLRQEKQLLNNEKSQTAHKLQSVMADYEREKQEKFELKCLLTEVNQQLEEHSAYCTSMGSVCGTLLWRASQCEESIQNIISGNRSRDFLCLVSTTVKSYFDSYGETPPNESSEETQFVLSLCGTVTNIAASAYGRDYISKCPEGQSLLQTLFDLLSTCPRSSTSVKLKSLILMLMYNVSINQTGLMWLRGLPSVFQVLIWLVKEETTPTCRLYSLQLVQSLLLKPHTPTLIHQVQEAVPVELLQELSSSSNPQLSQLACELMADIKSLLKHQ